MALKGAATMTTTILLVLILAVFLAAAAGLIFSIKSASAKIEELRRSQTENQALALMQQQIGQLTQNVNEQMKGMSDQFLKTVTAIGQQIQAMQGQFRETTGEIGKNLGDVQSHLGKVESATREVLEKSKDIATLQDLLRAPKFRGGMGELFLGDLLQQILPPANFELQHKFKTGETVDAVVKIGTNLVPIDSKFPLENFQKFVQEENPKEKEAFKKKFYADVKRHIDTIAEKYILPDEGTYEFALMYIPAENIYYETILKDEAFGEEKGTFTYAMQKKVMPVSPNSFYAYLQVIILGLKGLQIEKSAQEIIKSLARLSGDLGRFQTDFELIGTHLQNARSKYDDAEKRLDRFTDRLDKLSGGKPPELLESPAEEKNPR
jgi:DNA recombination protein RmuC